MASPVTCLSCGKASDPTYAYCPYCGVRRRAPADGEPAPGASGVPNPLAPSPYPPWSAAPGPSYEHRRAVERTRTGVALLAIGSAIGWIPVVSILGGILVLIGAILVILGREAFGFAHERNVFVAIVLYVIGLLGTLVLAGGFLGSLQAAAGLPPSDAPAAVAGAFNGFLIGAVIVGTFTGLATVLFLWSLLDAAGKILIVASFVASFAILFLVWGVIMGQVGPAAASAFAQSPPDLGPLTALTSQLDTLRLLNILPDLLAAGAAYVAWARIDRGDIPRRRGSTSLPP